VSFRGFWFGHAFELVEDAPKRILVKKKRLRRDELAELRRLWAKHADIRLGLFR
jgi:hypothetical protein